MIPSSTNYNTTNSYSTSSSSSSSACAACKYQRRRCGRDCPLAPYFPAEQQQLFLNAHRLFGVSNILKTLRTIPPHDRRARDDAMATIIFQSNARAADPVGGCYRIILDLQSQIERFSAELDLVIRQLHAFQLQAQAGGTPQAIDNNNAIVQDQRQQYFDYFYYENVSGSNGNGFGDVSNNGLEMDMLGLNQRAEEAVAVAVEEDARPLTVDMLVPAAPDDVDELHCSSKTSEPMAEHAAEPNAVEQVQEHELKEAASLLTLTHCNPSSL